MVMLGVMEVQASNQVVSILCAWSRAKYNVVPYQQMAISDVHDCHVFSSRGTHYKISRNFTVGVTHELKHDVIERNLQGSRPLLDVEVHGIAICEQQRKPSIGTISVSGPQRGL